MASIDIVIVSFQSASFIMRCLDGLNGQAQHEYRVQVVDNASRDSTVELVRRNFPDIKLIARATNAGFAVACNEGITAGSADFVLLLNPDTEVTVSDVDHLVDVLLEDPTIGVIGPKLLTADGTLDHACKRNDPSPVAAAQYLLGKITGLDFGSDYVATQLGDDEIGDVDAVNGAFMLMPRPAIQIVGMLDEKYWMYGEDLDWCRRFRNNGYRVVYYGLVSCLHLKGASSGQVRSTYVNWHFHKSMWLYYHDSNDRSWYFTPIIAVGICTHFLIVELMNILRRRQS